MGRRIKILTVGCKANFADSASIVREAAGRGYDVVPPGAPAEVVVINSCTVTHRADRDTRALARRARRENPASTIVVAGCGARVPAGPPAGLPEVDHWAGGDPSDPAGPLLALLSRLAGGTAAGLGLPSDHAADRLLGHRRTFLKIQDGCDRSCAYCVVPLARGRSRSVAEGDIVRRAVRAEEEGAREIVLTGIHVGLYGADLGIRDGLPRLLGTLLGATSRARYRLSSIEPMEVTDPLLDAVAGERRVCRHFHVPLQSGSDRVLSRMRRPYGAAAYRESVERIALRVPGVRVGADVIAGFPGETEADFEETVRLLRDLPVHALHAFPYSPRPGTESGAWPDDVAPPAKKERVARLIALAREKGEEFLGRQVGRTLEVLAERRRSDTRLLSGRADNYVPVAFPGADDRLGTIVPVRVTSVRGSGLAGVAG